MFRHQHHVGTGIALALTLAAIAPAAASAQPYPPASVSQTHATPRLDPRSREATNARAASIQAQGARVARELAALETANGTAIATIPPPTIVKISQRGFLTDALIGAGITLGLVLVLLGSSLYITHRRRALPINPAH
jgi:hypothetical protein